ncbi:tyrosine-type recombinase/integrase [Gordonia spumicola]|uniref:tyrosine-type recombinase/integrase n=1 Tax=Gordonia spumicola TaxID=589161 RepID=UPI001E3C5FF8|nr:tyrosine-type recombinase/integrase [Gordonia spumicola]
MNRSFKTEREARDFHARTLGASAAGTYVHSSKRTVEQACADWLASKHGLKTTTRRGYKSSLQPVRDELGTILIQRLTKRDVDDLVVALRAGEVDGRRAFTPRTVNQMLGLLSQVLDSEQAQGHVVRNVAKLVDKIPANPKRYRTLTETEMYAVLDHGCRKRHLWHLALFGMRRGEIAGLKWEHVDLKAGTVTIVETRVDGEDGEIVIDTPKSTTSARTLPLPVDVIDVLKAARAAQRRERLKLGNAYQGGDYVACDESGREYSPSQISDGWHRMLKRLSIDEVRLHDARHTCGTLMHLRGVPIAVISAWLGHASAAFTMATYAHSQDDALKAAGQAFERVEAN